MAKQPKKKTRKMKEAESKRMPKWLIKELNAMGEKDDTKQYVRLD